MATTRATGNGTRGQLLILLAVLALLLPARWNADVAPLADELHYAADGLWMRAPGSLAERYRRLVYDHVHPHVFYDAARGAIGVHGEMQSYALDVGRYPRAGHPGLYMLLLGAVYAAMPSDWTEEPGDLVGLARHLNLVLDVGTCLLFFLALRALLGGAPALAASLAYALLPLSFVFGTLAYLDAPSAFFAMAALWCYATRVRPRPGYRAWVALGALLGLSIAAKQSSLLLLPLFACLVAAHPPRAPLRASLAQVAASALACGAALLLLCNPVRLYAEMRQPTDPVLEVGLSGRQPHRQAARRLARLFQADQHHHFGRERHLGGPLVRSDLLVRLYAGTTAPLFGAFALASLWLGLRGRRWALALLAYTLALAVLLPVGAHVRRLYFALPFLLFAIAAGAADVWAWGARRGAAR